MDTEAILEYVKSEERINNERVFVLGRSLGGAVATYTVEKLVAQKDEWIKGVILENSFTSVEKIADRVFPFLKLIPNLKRRMLRLDWNSERAIQHITVPIFIIAGSRDQLCPMNMAKELLNAATGCNEKKALYVVPDGDHNNTFLLAGQNYIRNLRQFLDKCLGETGGAGTDKIESSLTVNGDDVTETTTSPVSSQLFDQGDKPENQSASNVVKCMIVGEPGCGKTSLTKQYLFGSTNHTDEVLTASKDVNGTDIEIFALEHNLSENELTKMVCKTCDLFVICVAADQEGGVIANADKWRAKISELNERGAPCVLMVTKSAGQDTTDFQNWEHGIVSITDIEDGSEINNAWNGAIEQALLQKNNQ